MPNEGTGALAVGHRAPGFPESQKGTGWPLSTRQNKKKTINNSPVCVILQVVSVDHMSITLTARHLQLETTATALVKLLVLHMLRSYTAEKFLLIATQRVWRLAGCSQVP